MDPDLFSPADTQALLAIAAVMAERRPARAELEALFASMGLVRGAGDASVDDLRVPSRAAEGPSVRTCPAPRPRPPAA